MVKIAMIGAGGVARNHRIAWKQQKNVHAVGVADILREKATSAAADLGAEYATDAYMDLLSSTDVDAVDICTTENTHADIAVAAAEHGKHILIEKPIATTINDADRIIKAASDNNIKLMIGQTHRFYDYSISAKEAIMDGEIGTPVYLHYSTGGGFWNQDWTGNRISPGDTGGNIVTNGVHITDLCNWWIDDKPISIYCQALNQTSAHLKMNDYFIFTIKYSNDAIAVVELSRANIPRTNQFRSILLLATDGQLSTGTQDESQWVDNDRGLEFLGPEYNHGFTRMISEFVDCLEGTIPTPVSGEDAKLALEMCLAAEESVETGEVVYLK